MIQDITENKTITAVFEKVWVNPYSNFSSGAWYYDAIGFVSSRSLMQGVGSQIFNPDGTMMRGMFVTVLYRLSRDTGSYTGAFSDVPSGTWYENASAWAAANGIVSGVGDGLFNPGGSITREQLAVMLYRYAQYIEYDVSVGEDTNILSYNDAFDISDYAYPALQWACGAGIINGDDNGNLNPQSSFTRAEAAAMLQKFIETEIS